MVAAGVARRRVAWGVESLAVVLIGVGLAAACGLRVFVPPLVMGAAARLGGVPLPADAAWLASWPALAVLTLATLLEVGGYYLPLVDNLLDLAAAPSALVVGTLIARAYLPELEPVAAWAAALALGGGAAGTVQALTSTLRLASTGATGGVANPLVASGENLGALLASLLALTLPLLSAALLLGALGWGAWRLARRRRAG